MEWKGEVDDFKGGGRILNRALRETIKLLNANTPKYFPIDLPLTEQERSSLPCRQPGFTLGIQTHLSGMKTKLWGLNNWRLYLESLLAADRQLRIFLLDNDPSVEELCVDPRIKSTRDFNIFQS
ncbi:MAG: hypothetical protein WCH43_10100, partial [Verrucomicrobiota bacterium]